MATQSSSHPDFPAENCIDGETKGPVFDPSDGVTVRLCHTKNDIAPWIALHYVTPVTVQRVVLFNREDCCGERTKEVKVRISDELPRSGRQLFTGGTLFGSFDGPADDGEKIVITGQNHSNDLLLICQAKRRLADTSLSR